MYDLLASNFYDNFIGLQPIHNINGILAWPSLGLCNILTKAIGSKFSLCLLSYRVFQFALIETIATAIMDRFPQLRPKKFWVVLIMCLVGFCAGLPLCTRVR